MQIVNRLCIALSLALSACGGGPTQSNNDLGSSGNNDLGPGSADLAGSGQPLAVVAACATPTVTDGATLNAGAGNRFFAVALARAADGLGIAYARSTANGWTIELQRLTEAGAQTGSPVTLGTTSILTPTVALASNAQSFVACWDDQSGVSCANGAGAAGAKLDGSAPALAWGASGWLLARVNASGIVAQKLDGNGQAQGNSAPVTSVTGASPSVIAAGDGFWVSSGTAGGKPQLFPVDSALAVGNPAPLSGSLNGQFVALGNAGDGVAAVWAEQSQISTATVSASGTAGATAKVADDGSYGRVSVIGGAASFATAWSSQGGTIRYRALDGSGAPVGSAQAPLMTGWDDNPNALVAVHDGFVLAANSSSTPGSAFDVIAVKHLGCP
jgi:hypothetical protein